MKKYLLLIAACWSILFLLSSQHLVQADVSTDLVINEVMAGPYKAIELFNKGVNPINLSTISLEIYHQGASYLTTYTFPPGTSIGANGYVVLHLYTGSNSTGNYYLPYDPTIFWNSGGAVILIESATSAIDFVRFNGSTKLPPSDTTWTGLTPIITDTENTLGRNAQGNDTDDGSDWIEQTPTLGSQNLAQSCYFLTITTEGEGATPTASVNHSDGCNAGFYHSGTAISLIGGTPESTWEISGWQGTTNDASLNPFNSVIMPEQDHLVTIIYTRIPLDTPMLILPDDGFSSADNAITFQWSGVEDAANYQLQFSDNALFDGTVELRESSSATTVISDLGVGHWYWRVKATGERPDSAWSAVRLFTIKPPAVTIIGPPDGTATTDHTPNFIWEAFSGATHYVIQVSPREDFSILPINHFVTSGFFAPGIAMINQGYWWRVKVFANGVWSDWSETRSITITGAPGQPQPTLLSPEDGATTTNHTPTFDWEDVATAERYRIHISKDPNFKPLIVNQLITDSEFTPGVWMNSGTYYWRVQAMGGGDASWFSFKRTITIE